MADKWHYPRQNLAEQYGRRLQDTLFSRIALIGSRRIGKTAFVINDLSPELIEAGCIPIYISLWSDRSAPHNEFIAKLEAALFAVKNKSTLRSLLNTDVTKLAVGSSAFGKFEMEFGSVKAHSSELLQIRSLLCDLVELADGKRVVLLLDEIQHLVTDSAFNDLQHTLRSILDELGSSISVLYTGSSRAGMAAMFENPDLPFYHSAQPSEFPKIDDQFVDFCIEQLKTYNLHYSKVELLDYWHEIDSSPYWMIQLMRRVVLELSSLSEGISFVRKAIAIDGNFDAILSKMSMVEQLVLIRLARKQPLYSAKSFEYFESLNINTSRSKIQSAIGKLKTKRLVTKLPNGEYLIEASGLIAVIQAKFEKLEARS